MMTSAATSTAFKWWSHSRRKWTLRRFRHFLTCNKIHTLCYWFLTLLGTRNAAAGPAPCPQPTVFRLVDFHPLDCSCFGM